MVSSSGQYVVCVADEAEAQGMAALCGCCSAPKEPTVQSLLCSHASNGKRIEARRVQLPRRLLHLLHLLHMLLLHLRRRHHLRRRRIWQARFKSKIGDREVTWTQSEAYHLPIANSVSCRPHAPPAPPAPPTLLVGRTAPPPPLRNPLHAPYPPFPLLTSPCR